MTSDVTVREGHPADVEGIQRVAEETWHEVYDDILGADAVDEVLGEWYDEEAIEASVQNDAQDFFVAVRDDRVVGYAHVGPHPPRRVFLLYRLYVRPEDWNQGIGKDLLANVEQALYDRDVGAYEVEVLADNDVGTSFYESTGFERVGEEETELGGVSVTERHYRKRL